MRHNILLSYAKIYNEVTRVKTLYIDVYFLINFTVDILAAFFAFKISHINVKVKHLFLIGIFGAILALFDLFCSSNYLLRLFPFLIFTLLLYITVPRNTTTVRKIKYMLLFYFSAFLIGGAVDYFYSLLDRYFPDYLASISGVENRKILVFSLIILLTIGLFRGVIMIFTGSMEEKILKMYININGKEILLDALVDSGNLVKDPMNMNSVVFIKKHRALSILPENVTEISELSSINNDMKKRIRLIPVTRCGVTHMMSGVLVDEIGFIKENQKRSISATLVIDKEEGTFGGYDALAPYMTIYDDN